MRAKDLVFHINCFTCASCNKTLTTGDQFGMQDDLIYCRTDYEIIFQGDYFSRMHPALPCPNNGHIPFYNGVGTAVQKGRPRKRKNHVIDHDGCPPGMGKEVVNEKSQKSPMRVSWTAFLVIYNSYRVANMVKTWLQRFCSLKFKVKNFFFGRKVSKKIEISSIFLMAACFTPNQVVKRSLVSPLFP